jgi:predicted DNA-binding transcriptional regulator AlpA
LNVKKRLTNNIYNYTLNLTLKKGEDMEPLITDKIFREQIIGVSSVTWWNWRKKGKLPAAVVIGRRRYYRCSDIEAWLEELVSVKSANCL